LPPVETLGAFSLTFVSAICYYYIMKKFNTVEDYLEVIAGYRDIVSGNRSSNWFLGFEPIISLARYDTDVLDSMSQSAINGQALTERQGELACKIILKYQRQLAAKYVDVSPVEKPVWRQPLRKMDYSKRLYLQDDSLFLRFPYDSKLIESVRSFKSTSQGSCEFSMESKVWKLGLTEYNLNWAHSWAHQHGFEVDPAITDLFNKIVETEGTEYKIELVCNDTGLDITNCPASLRSYIQDHQGGFGFDNLLRLVDSSAELGFTIEEDLQQALLQEYGPRFLRIATNREMRIVPESRTAVDDLASVLEYAIRTDRCPVVIYEPDLSGKMLNRLQSLYPPEMIMVTGNSRVDSVAEGIKFIHTIKPLRALPDIPLLVSGAGMVFGGDKQTMIQCARKIVYVAAEVYNKSQSKSTKVIKIAS